MLTALSFSVALTSGGSAAGSPARYRRSAYTSFSSASTKYRSRPVGLHAVRRVDQSTGDCVVSDGNPPRRVTPIVAPARRSRTDSDIRARTSLSCIYASHRPSLDRSGAKPSPIARASMTGRPSKADTNTFASRIV